MQAEEVNEFLQKNLMLGGGGMSAPRSQSVKEKAQDIVYDAWEASGKKRVQLANQAIGMFEDCADAYVVFAVLGSIANFA